MRIIAGEARGRTLLAPSGRDTRPTQDRVRESLFNILRLRVGGARVLDLFAGSGALSLEAISRGAARATLVDAGRPAQDAAARNIETLGWADRARLVRADYRDALRRLAVSGERFDLIFLDPPYRMPGADETPALCAPLLAPGGMIVCEHARALPPGTPEGFAVADARAYGDTVITFFTREGED